MGSLSDRGTSYVSSVCEKTNYPKDEHGHLLEKHDIITDELFVDWDVPGTKLYNMTSPYGHLFFVVGSSDDFFCFDYAIIRLTTSSGFIILHSVINSDTGCYILDDQYEVIHINDWERQALDMVENALDWLAENNLKHNKTGWNQDPYFFYRSVEHKLHRTFWSEPGSLRQYSQRQFRFGGKRINRFCGLEV